MRVPLVCTAIIFAGLVGISDNAGAAPAAPERQPTISGAIPVQGWRERCRYLRHRLRELEERRAYAPPWEQRRFERRIWRAREELRESRCW
jgi:hypothetical protein